eukprot:4969569-Prymnesium_polylepis.1
MSALADVTHGRGRDGWCCARRQRKVRLGVSGRASRSGARAMCAARAQICDRPCTMINGSVRGSPAGTCVCVLRVDGTWHADGARP